MTFEEFLIEELNNCEEDYDLYEVTEYNYDIEYTTQE